MQPRDTLPNGAPSLGTLPFEVISIISENAETGDLFSLRNVSRNVSAGASVAFQEVVFTAKSFLYPDYTSCEHLLDFVEHCKYSYRLKTLTLSTLVVGPCAADETRHTLLPVFKRPFGTLAGKR